MPAVSDAVRQTLLAPVYDVAKETPLYRTISLSGELGFDVYLKREDLQQVHSFKLRGAYTRMAALTPAERKRGVIAASAGNHAQGVALSAQKLGINAVIVMPTTTPQIKIDAVRRYGATPVLHGDSYSDAYERAMALVKKDRRVFVHPFDDPLVIAGQGTVGREILEQLAGVTHIFIPVGGGGLLAGIAQYVKQLKPEIKVIGVDPADSNAMQASLRAGKRVVLPHVGIFADGVAVKQVGEHTFAITKKCVDEVMTVDVDQMCAAIKRIFEATRSIVEPAGALGVAGVEAYAADHDMKNAKVVAICSGANMTFERLQFVAERTLIGGRKEALYAVTMPETAGTFQRFCNEVVTGHNVSQFSYRLNSRTQAHILVGIGLRDAADKTRVEKAMTKHGYSFKDLTGDELAKEHIRYMIGGPAFAAKSEKLYHIDFPERPGSLGQFLEAVSGRWNISLFHYRGQGGDTGRVLIGFETADPKPLEKVLTGTGFDWTRADNDATKLFL